MLKIRILKCTKLKINFFQSLKKQNKFFFCSNSSSSKKKIINLNTNYNKKINSLQSDSNVIENVLKYFKKRAKKSFFMSFVYGLFFILTTNWLIIIYFNKYNKISNISFNSNEEFFKIIPPKNKDEISDEEFFKKSNKINFSSICGNDEAKEQLKDLVNFFHDSSVFNKFKAKMPKGILFTGPPGCGKTLMAKALANEANVTFISTNGSSFEEIYVGVGSMRVKKLFKVAKSKAPCVIFIDEIDSIGHKRTPLSSTRMSLNQLLSEMDGFKSTEGIIVVAATNMPKKLDRALTRSGRFDRIIEVHLPDKVARKNLFKYELKNKPVSNGINLDDLASQTTGLSGADLVNIVNSAAIETIKKDKSKITQKALREAISHIHLGRVKKSLTLSPNVLWSTAVHEAGHTVAALYTKGAHIVNQLTILPRGMALGVTWLSPKEGTQYEQTREELLGQIDVAMAGHVAEELFFGKENVSTGAASDFNNATQIAFSLVGEYGMSEKNGKFSVDLDNFGNLSPFIKKRVFNEVQNVLNESYERVLCLLKEQKKRKLVEKLAKKVLEKETLNKKEIYIIARLPVPIK